MKKNKAFCAILLGLCLFLTGCSGRIPESAEMPTVFEKGAPVTGQEVITLENESFIFDFDPKRCTFSLTEKHTGAVWLSNPAADYQDSYAANITKTDLQSQMIVTYKKDVSNLRVTNTSSSAVLKKSFTVAVLEQGIRVDYSFREGFDIPLMYTLNDDGFSAKVLYGEIAETADASVCSVQLLPYFGAADESAEGYMFVPDGSGALIDFNNGKTSCPPYTKMVYGVDESLPNYYEVSREEQISLPVFGMKRADGAFLALIEEGDGFAYINACVSGVKTALNNVFATGVYRATERLTILNGSLGTAGNSLYTALHPVSQNAFSVKYIFLKPESTDYSGMAEAYREHLNQNGGLKKSGDTLSLYAEFYGGVSKKMSIAGIQYEGLSPLTKFNQAKDMLMSLQENGVEHITAAYYGVGKDGYKGKPGLSVTPAGELGGVKGWKELVSYAEKNNISLFVQSDFYAFSKSGGGFSKFFDVSKTLDMSASVLWYKGLNTNIRDVGRGKRYLLKPVFYKEAMDAVRRSAEKNSVSGILLDDLSKRLSGDYASNGTGRQQVIEELKKMVSGSALPLMLKTPNAYMLGGADAALDIPVYSSQKLIFDRDIPFYQMVLHGSMPYGGYALNINNSTENAFLKHLESMTALSYAYMAASADELQNTPLVNLYGLGNGNLQSAAEAYKVFKTVGGYVQNEYAVEHSVSGNISVMTYTNGVTVAVNYSVAEEAFKGVVIPQRGWAVIKDGAVMVSGSEVPLFE